MTDTIQIQDLRVDISSLGSKKLLVDVLPVYEYKDGKKSDVVTAFKYVTAFPAHRLKKLAVKIDGTTPLLTLNNADYIEVEFDNLEISAYTIQQQIILSAKATGIKQIDTKKQN